MKRELCPFGKEIKKALIDVGITQEELAQQVGTTPKYMTHILFGTRSGAKYRARITSVLGIEDRHCADSAAS